MPKFINCIKLTVNAVLVFLTSKRQVSKEIKLDEAIVYPYGKLG